jgi:protein-disulfide isomerase
LVPAVSRSLASAGAVRDVVLAIAIAAASLSGLWWLLAREAQNDDSWIRELDVPVILEPRLLLGDSDAPAVVVVASDFQCPFCAIFATQTFPRIRTEFVETGRVSFYFRHFIGTNHRLAAPAAALAECAGATGAFWPVHDKLFAAHPFLTQRVLDDLKASLVSARGTRGPCSEELAVVKEDTRWAVELGATGSPTFFFGKRVEGSKVLLEYAFGGTRPLADFRKVLDRLGED